MNKCELCRHQDVCMYMPKFFNVLEKIEKLNIPLEFKAELTCKYYDQRVTLRGDTLTSKEKIAT